MLWDLLRKPKSSLEERGVCVRACTTYKYSLCPTYNCTYGNNTELIIPSLHSQRKV